MGRLVNIALGYHGAAVPYWKKSTYRNFTGTLTVYIFIFEVVDLISQASIVPSGWRPSLLLFHAVHIYTCTASFVFAVESRAIRDTWLMVVYFFLNTIMFIIRIITEIYYMDLRTPVYSDS
ncbi:hypothetical protein J8273_4709 [Carpediemonas membranifera]|uniref:Uncharacterized protein n=1 Tax=Carpediemonas membranifera TaxID=201153 RepID=A0A8J6BXU8_9EUKA|nr:hypothetical protein J8273_4709 [Carpediemonas membranifera]|eukprot:KAG9393846.1 hypothetical protein J8273_4709 [Carpediemonas membranifera]